MFSIISFFNVRMNGGMKNSVMPYAALGVGLAIVLTIGLTAIAGVVSQPLMESQKQTEEQQALTTAPAPAPAPAITQREAGVSSTAGSATAPSAPVEEKSLAKQEQSYVTTETPAGPFEGLSVAIPYIAAAVVGSVVFVVARKRVGL